MQSRAYKEAYFKVGNIDHFHSEYGQSIKQFALRVGTKVVKEYHNRWAAIMSMKEGRGDNVYDNSLKVEVARVQTS